MQDQLARCNCQSLFRVKAIPSDICIRCLLDSRPFQAFDSVFRLCLDTLRDQGTVRPFLRLDNRLLVALE